MKQIELIDITVLKKSYFNERVKELKDDDIAGQLNSDISFHKNDSGLSIIAEAKLYNRKKHTEEFANFSVGFYFEITLPKSSKKNIKKRYSEEEKKILLHWRYMNHLQLCGVLYIQN